MHAILILSWNVLKFMEQLRYNHGYKTIAVLTVLET